MKLYLATSPYYKIFDLLKKNDAKNILVSRAFYKKVGDYIDVSKNWWPENLMVDSGAFSVWTGGKDKNKQPVKIDIDRYIDFCKTLEEWADWPNLRKCKITYVNLDVLPGKFGQRPTSQQREESAEEGWQNMEYMISKGITPIHVFHQHENFKWLDKMMKKLDYIGISPANDVSMKEKMAWLNKVFSVVKMKVKTHGFAVTSQEQVLRYPFYSVDSSSWTAGGRYARTPFFKDGKIVTLNYKDKNKLNEHFENATIKEGSLDDYDYLKRQEEGLRSYMALEAFANEVWAKRGIIWSD